MQNQEQNNQNSLDRYKEKGNLLMPTTNITQVTPWHRMTITEVKIDSDPDNGEVFKQASKAIREKGPSGWDTTFIEQFSLGKVALMKIAQAAGITWDYAQCGPITVNRDYVLYKAVGQVRLPAGNWQVIPANKEIDLSVIEDELMEQNLKKAAEYAASTIPKEKAKLQGMDEKEWAERQTKSAMIQWRKHKLARAETGAMERVIRAALSMKQTYTKAELAKPFIVPRIDFSPDYSDPNVQRMMLENGMRAMSSLFGSAAALQTFTPMPENVITIVPEEDPEEEAPEESEMNDQPETPTEEPEQAQEEIQKPVYDPNDCQGCGAQLTDGIRKYSEEKHGKPLCMACQKKQ